MKVLIEFDLLEEVTPELFAGKVALACSKQYVIREGESVSVRDSGARRLDGSGRYMNKFSFIGHVLTDMGGVLKEKIDYPNIESSLVD